MIKQVFINIGLIFTEHKRKPNMQIALANKKIGDTFIFIILLQ